FPDTRQRLREPAPAEPRERRPRRRRAAPAALTQPHEGRNRRHKEEAGRERPDPADALVVRSADLAEEREREAGGDEAADVAEAPAEAGDPAEAFRRPEVRQEARDERFPDRE